MRRALLLGGLAAGCGEAEDLALALGWCTSRIAPAPEDPEGSLHRVTIEGSGARCNDGTPPVVWVEPSSDREHARDWVLYLEGGSGCSDAAGCEDRWCGRADIGGPWVMSSAWAAERRSVGGLFEADDPRDATRAWNKAFLHYCSSDYWLGAAPSPVTLRSGSPDLRLWFQGHEVLLAQLDALDRGLASDDGTVATDPLTDAARILVVGSSAGGVGATHHLDLVAGRYADAWVRGVIEGTSAVDRTLLAPERRYAADFRLDVRRTFVDPIWGAWSEPDCVGATCGDPFLLYTRALATPFVLRHDLRDPLFLDVTRAIGLEDAAAADLMSETALGIAEVRPDVSVVETNCARHVVATDPEHYTLKVGEDPVSLSDAITALVLGERVVAVDVDPPETSICP